MARVPLAARSWIPGAQALPAGVAAGVGSAAASDVEPR